jgi:Na+-translocating ferredoxin:NAD+ oxidoreductase RnfG subunit|tara:strand:+ start:269 stop:565 length:297 start_codon:yes stop_codon:yes gene_type:complete
MKLFKILFILSFLIFLNGCLQTTAMLGPGLTIATTGNVLQAGFQYGANSVIEKETGKNTLELFQDVVDHQSKNKKFQKKFINVVEKQFKLTREKLNLN